MIYADALAFLGMPGGPVAIEDGFNLNLAHVTAVKPWLKTMAESVEDLRQFVRQVETTEGLTPIYDGEAISEAIKNGKTAVVFGMQNLPKDADIGLLHKEGVRVIAPAYDEENKYGSGWMNAGIPLRHRGWEFLESCADLRMIVDLSHLGHRMAREIVGFVKQSKIDLRVMASHGGCYACYPHMRNLPDDVLKGVAELGGVVGIPTVTWLLDNYENTIDPFYRHLRYAVNLCGTKTVVVGSDAPYVMMDLAQERENFSYLKSKLDPDGVFGVRIPQYPRELNGARRMSSLFDLCSLGDLSKSRLQDIFGHNLLGFFEQSVK